MPSHQPLPLKPTTKQPNPSVEQPPSLLDLVKSLVTYHELREKHPDINDEAAWDIARSKTWSHWKLQELIWHIK